MHLVLRHVDEDIHFFIVDILVAETGYLPLSVEERHIGAAQCDGVVSSGIIEVYVVYPAFDSGFYLV